MSAPPEAMEGRVDEVHGMLVTVALPDGRRLRARPPRDRTMPVVGDLCHVIDEGADHYRIDRLAPRERVFSRCLEHGVKPLAAHIDRLVIVSAVEPPARAGLVDRFIIAADPDIEILLVLNKIDLDGSAEALEALADHAAAGCTVLPVSVRGGVGIDRLREALASGVSMFVGHSGVGKSSLLNALLPGLGLQTGDVNDTTGKGRHTTTVATLHPLPGGAAVIDAPGVRAWPLDGLPLPVLAQRFPGLGHLAAACHMADCLHDGEPGCAVVDAVAAGELPEARLQRYLDLKAATLEERATRRQASFHDQRNRGARRR